MSEELGTHAESPATDQEIGGFPADGPRARRKWLAEEDEKLRLLVSYWGDQCGKNSHWDKISSNFENRTPKDCRKRWFYSLDPKLKRGRWTQNEDKTLMEAYQRLGPAWQRISQLIPGRTDDQCSKRYNDVLDPSISDRLRPWSAEEDERLERLVEEFGSKWQRISREMSGRTGLTCRNRWRKLTRDSAGLQGSTEPELGLSEPHDASSRSRQRLVSGSPVLADNDQDSSGNEVIKPTAVYSVTLESHEPGHPPPMHNAISEESTKRLIEEACERNLKVVIHKHVYMPWPGENAPAMDRPSNKRQRFTVQAPDDDLDDTSTRPALPDEDMFLAPNFLQPNQTDENNLFSQDFDPDLYLAFNPS